MPVQGARQPLVLALVAIASVILAIQVVRTAAVADRLAKPGLAAALWPSHPAVLTDRALLAIAKAASVGRGVPDEARADLRRVARAAPLSPDPFLVKAAVAASEGRAAQSERLLLTARGRDPRSRGARYLLAERYLATGRVAAGLMEMHALVGLQTAGSEALGPALVAYARSPGAIPQLRAFFGRYPALEAGILNMLATESANTDLVLALARNVRTPQPDWRINLLNGLVADKQYARALSVWARLTGERPVGGLFNPAFVATPAPPPFNWQFPLSVDGVAEPDGKGGLSLLYYGRAKAVLASQLLVLSPGSYRLAMQVGAAGNDGSVRWTLRCADADRVIAQIPLRPGVAAAAFVVPAGCAAQWLELEGIPAESPRTGELTIRGLRLDRAAATS